MSKRIRTLSTLAGVLLLSTVVSLAQGMQGHQSWMTNGSQSGTAHNNSWYQRMMQQRQQLETRVEATDHKLSEELQQLKAAKTDDQKVKIMQTMFLNLIDERDYVHDQVLPILMYGGGMMYGDGAVYGHGMMQNGRTNGQAMQSGHMGMQNSQSGMASGSQSSTASGENSRNNGNNDWYRGMLRQRQDLESHVENTDKTLAGQLQELQAAKTDTQKINVMQSMLATLIRERTYVHDQALSMTMLTRQTESARP
jgi:hypothetical protein